MLAELACTGLFMCWKFRLFYLWLFNLQLQLYLSFSPLFSGSSREIDIIVFAEVNWIFHILKFCTFSL